MKRLWAILLIIAVLFPVFASGDKEAAEPENGEITISLWYTANESDPNDRDHRWNTENIELFQQAHPNIKVVPTVIGGAGGNDYRMKLNAELAAGNAPDVFMVWERGRLEPFVEGGMVLDLTDIIKNDPVLDSVVNPENLNGMSFDGRVYAIPDAADLHGIFYNKEYFKKYNVEIPKTNDELIAAAEVFRANGITPIAFGNSVAWVTQVPYSCYFHELNGADAYDRIAREGHVDFNDPMYVAPMEELARIAEAGVFSENFNGIKPPESMAAFKEGKAAMVLQGTWQVNGLVSAMGDNVGFFCLPGINGESTVKSVAIPKGYSISSRSKHQEAAIELLKFMYSPERQAAYCEYGAIPASRNYAIDTENTSQLKLDVIEIMNSDRTAVANIDIYCDSAVQPEFQKVVQGCAGGASIEDSFAKLQSFKKMAEL